MRGVLYVAYGPPARRCLSQSVTTLRMHHHDVAVLVLSDEPVEDLPTKIVETKDPGARSVKSRLSDFVPDRWEEVLYLDVDTVILKPLTRFWEPLSLGWDMVICRDETAAALPRCRLKSRIELRETIDQLGTPYHPQLAGGAIAWRVNEKTDTLFQRWHREWRRYGRRDQGALMRAIVPLDLKVWMLEFNANAKHREHAVEIWHQHGRARRRGCP